MQAEGVQRGQLRSAAPGIARAIDVLDAHEPFAVGVPGQQPAAESGQQRTEMQRPGGRGRETAAICHGAGLEAKTESQLALEFNRRPPHIQKVFPSLPSEHPACSAASSFSSRPTSPC
jgi:hypothetical protein